MSADGGRAAIDIGSNSLLLTVVDRGGRVVHDEARVVRLGAGLGDRGLFRQDRMEAAREALLDYVKIAQDFGVPPGDVRAVATSAARRALNARTFFEGLTRDGGLRVQIISGEEEARLTWLGATGDLELPDGASLVMDPGGGSTELVLGIDNRIIERTSVELGVVRLTEEFLTTGTVNPRDLARARDHVREVMSGIRLPYRPRAAVAVGGTATTLAAVEAGLSSYNAEVVHGFKLTRMSLRRWVDRLLGADALARRAMITASPERADYLLAGVIILDQALELAGRQSLIVSDQGLRYGVLIDSE